MVCLWLLERCRTIVSTALQVEVRVADVSRIKQKRQKRGRIPDPLVTSGVRALFFFTIQMLTFMAATLLYGRASADASE